MPPGVCAEGKLGVKHALLWCEKCVIKVGLVFCSLVLLHTQDVRAQVGITPDRMQMLLGQRKSTSPQDQSAVPPLAQSTLTETNIPEPTSCSSIHICLPVHIQLMHRLFILRQHYISARLDDSVANQLFGFKGLTGLGTLQTEHFDRGQTENTTKSGLKVWHVYRRRTPEWLRDRSAGRWND